MSTRSVDELLGMSDECRDLAAITTSETIREQLLELADQFERLARFQSDRAKMLGRMPAH